jgi:hypothetical protein
MKRLYNVSLLLLLFICIIANTGLPAYASPNDDIKVIINGQKLAFDVPPNIKDGITLVPFRAVFEALGANNIGWDAENKIATAFKNNTLIILQIGKKTASVNNSVKELMRAPEVVAGRTMVPLRFVSEALGADVKWDGTKREINITLETQGSTQNSSNNNQIIFEPGVVIFD